jgi:hypothetical protein
VTKTAPPQVSFSSGEIDPLLHRRFDYQRFQTGMAKCRGFLPLPQGGFTRAPGTVQRGTVDSADVILVPFVFAQDDAVVLEFTPLKMRVWRYGSLIMAGASPYEIATPFDAASLSATQWVQSADVIYQADGQRAIQKLARFALDNWSISEFELNSGPFRVQNLEKTHTMQASNNTGTVTLTSSAAYFTAAHVGMLMLLLPTDLSAVALWAAEEEVNVGEVRRYDGNSYLMIRNTRSDDNNGSTPPTHTEGEEQVTGRGAVTWRFIDDGRGIVRITAVTSATQATVTVIKAIPESCVDDPTYRWSEGAWNEINGYPRTLQFYDQRLAAAASKTEPRSIWFSTVGDFADFEPGVEADDAFAYTISGDDTQNSILSLKRGRSGLHVLALGEEYSTRSESRTQAIGPTTAVFSQDSSIGSSQARPISVDGAPLFITRDKRGVMILTYSLESNANISTNLSIAAQHFGAAGFEQIVWQARPQRTAWLRTTAGDLIAMVFDPQEDVLGWAKVPLAGGRVMAMSVTPDLTGSQDTLTMIVERVQYEVVAGDLVPVTRYCVEELTKTYDILTGAASIASACHLYSAYRYEGAAQASFTIPHLAGQEVYAWTSAGGFGPITAGNGGEVTLPADVTSAWIGLFDATHQGETLDITAQSAEGNTFGRQKRLWGLGIGLHQTVQGWVQTIERELGQADRISARQSLIPVSVGSGSIAAFAGIASIPAPTGQAKELAGRITPQGGAPLTVTALTPIVEEAGR